ncbi:MAG TPA: energy transducer TonB [Rhodocyclaceae bacterium]|nr:energy transducer TonB [Rhodocyclaceae bacterium]
MSEAPHVRVTPPGKRIAIVLAVLVHLGLAAFLIYGIRWQTKVRDVVEVELVRPVPSPAPVANPEPPPEPKPEIKPEPKPEPIPVTKPLPPPKPDIAIKAKEKPKPPPKEEPKQKFDPFREQLAKEEKQRALDDRIADNERRLKQQQEAQAAAQASAARSKALASYSDRIRAKIRGNIVLPPDLKGNPSAVFEVVQLPSGEVISARLVKGSGHAGYDAAVERAILKSSPLPRPDDPGLFERSLRLIFCPVEDGKCG